SAPKNEVKGAAKDREQGAGNREQTEETVSSAVLPAVAPVLAQTESESLTQQPELTPAPVVETHAQPSTEVNETAKTEASAQNDIEATEPTPVQLASLENISVPAIPYSVSVEPSRDRQGAASVSVATSSIESNIPQTAQPAP